METKTHAVLSSTDLNSILEKITAKKQAQLSALGIKPEDQKKLPESVKELIHQVSEKTMILPEPEIPEEESPEEIIEEFQPEPEFLSHEQIAASEYIISGKSCCVIGKAGTGKTTAIKETVKRLQQRHKAVPMRSIDGHKYLREGSLGVVCCAFTNRAINNISKSFDLGSTQINFMTIHKLLEYIKEEYMVEDKEKKGEMKRSFRFTPSRDRHRKLPSGIHTIIIEESSMVSNDGLWAKLLDACHPHVQFVFLGDLQQLPPFDGDGVLGYKLNELPCFELTKIYRQAAENPIIRLAWDVSTGTKFSKKMLEETYCKDTSPSAPIKISFYKHKIEWEAACVTMGKFFCNLIDKKIFDWENDIILIPFNKKLGSIVLNAAIAQHLSYARNDPTWEIIAGFQKYYFAQGDKVLYNKKEGVITKIVKNGRYIGKNPLPPSVDLHRDGSYHARDAKGVVISPENLSEADIELQLMALMETSEDDITNQASHVVHIELLTEQLEDGSTEVEVSTRGEIAKLELAYAITIHKAQGSEWKKVFLVIHNSHFSINREMLYTAITRASQQLFIMCEADSFSKAVERQRIPGSTLEEKKEWFRTKIEEREKKKRAGLVAVLEEEDE